MKCHWGTILPMANPKMSTLTLEQLGLFKKRTTELAGSLQTDLSAYDEIADMTTVIQHCLILKVTGEINHYECYSYTHARVHLFLPPFYLFIYFWLLWLLQLQLTGGSFKVYSQLSPSVPGSGSRSNMTKQLLKMDE